MVSLLHVSWAFFHYIVLINFINHYLINGSIDVYVVQKDFGWHRLPWLVSWIRCINSVQNKRWQTCVGWLNTFWVQRKWCTFHFWTNNSFNCKPRKKIYLLTYINIFEKDRCLQTFEMQWVGLPRCSVTHAAMCKKSCPGKAQSLFVLWDRWMACKGWVSDIVNYC